MIKFPTRLINKFYVKNLGPFLDPKIVDFYKKYHENPRHGTEAVASVINSEIDNLELAGHLEDIEQAFFDYVYVNEQEISYYKTLIPNGLTADDIFHRIQNNPIYTSLVNQKLYSWDPSADENVVSIRKSGNAIKILFHFGVYKTKSNVEKAFFVSAKIDFSDKVIVISLNNNAFRSLKGEGKTNILDLLAKIKRRIDIMTIADGDQRLLTWVNFDDIPIQKALYKVFKEESDNAIEVIQGQVERETKEEFQIEEVRETVRAFLENELRLESADEFVDKAISLKYQDVAIRLEEDDYVKNGGFIFGFGFIDKRITRSENKSFTKEPVYNSKIFWSLRDNINEFKEIASLSVDWLFNQNDLSEKINPKNYNGADICRFQVQLKADHGNLKIHLIMNVHNRTISSKLSEEIERRELYALRKIKKYLSKESSSEAPV